MLCYKALVRPVMEYACTVWDPHTQKNITKLEMVQRKYAQFIFNNLQRTSSVLAMLNHLQWPSLQERRAQYKVVMVYRCVNHLVDIPLTYYQAAPVATLRGHTQKYVIPFARTLAFQRSFFPDSIGLWNLLPQETIGCATLDQFRRDVQHIQLRH